MFAPQATNVTRMYRVKVKGPNPRSRDIDANTFNGNETLSVYLYVGDPTTALATISGSWDTTEGPSPTAEGQPIVKYEITPSVLTGITNFEPGLYRYQVVANPSTDKVELAYGLHEFTAGPGALTAASNYQTADGLAVYGTFDKIRRFCPWVTQLITKDRTMRANLSEFRNEARARIDGFLVNRGGEYSQETIKDYLSDDKLLLTGPDGMRLLKASALYAAAFLCQSQIGSVPDSETPYETKARQWLDEADALVRGGPAWLDTDGDGVGDIKLYPGRVRIERG